MMMMKHTLILFLGMLTGTMAMRAQAQTGVITHTIRQGETLSALSVKYKTTVGDIMRLNNMNANSKLSIGQKVKIPSSGKSVAASKPAPAPATSAGTVTTHTVQQGETLYRISQKYHVKVNQIKTWNHLTGDNVSIGQVLSIGTYASAAPVQNTTPVEEPPVANTPPPTTAPPASTPPQTTTPQTTQPQTTATPPASTSPAPSSTAATPANKPAVNNASVPNREERYVDQSKVTDKGYFESLFGVDVAGRSLEKASGAAMTFKTASGWTDKKYYILVNDIAPGSIVKITNAEGNKTIYAKVLWNMGDLKENEGLSYRISNAAADALGISDLKFQISIAYYD